MENNREHKCTTSKAKEESEWQCTIQTVVYNNLLTVVSSLPSKEVILCI